MRCAAPTRGRRTTRSSSSRLRRRRGSGGRPVVLAADIDAVQPSGSGAEVRLGGSLTRSAVAALHVEHPVHSADGELLWYDASELGAVVALLASGRD